MLGKSSQVLGIQASLHYSLVRGEGKWIDSWEAPHLAAAGVFEGGGERES